MKSTRETILHTMLEKNRTTIGELATAVGINSISVRHHIAKLEAEGLVSSEEERHGVGRPRRVYFLTDKGMESFPSRYVQMSNRIIEQIKSSFPSDVIRELFSKMARSITAKYTDSDKLSSLNMEERLDLLKNVMAQEGVIIDWEKQGEEYQIKGNSCPYLQIEQNHPEICLLDKGIISTLLAVPQNSVQFSRKSGEHCVYTIPNNYNEERKNE